MSPLAKADARVAAYALAGLFALVGMIREARR